MVVGKIDRFWKEFERGLFIHTPSAQQDDWEGKGRKKKKKKGGKRTEIE